MGMQKITKVCFISLILVIYFVAFNLVFLLDFSTLSESFSSSPQGANEVAALGDSVSVSSFHDGFFWDVKTSYYSDYRNSKIYFFGFIPLPKVIYNYNFIILHFVVGIIFLAILTKIIFSSERRYYGE